MKKFRFPSSVPTPVIVIFVILLPLVVLLSSCASLGVKVTSDIVTEVGAAGQNFDKQMTAFLVNWPYLSGVLEGFFLNRTGDVTVSMREAREKIDEIWERGQASEKWAKRDLGLAFGYSVNLFNLAVKEFMSRLAPGLLKFIPAIA